MERKDVKWNDDRPRMAYQLALLGLTDKEIAKVMDVNINTLDLWKRTRPEFAEKLHEGKVIADAKVSEALFKKACGFWEDVTEVFNNKGDIIEHTYKKYFPPDSWAANKWLSIRQRPIWADVQRIETTQTNINITKIDLTGFSTEELKLMHKMGMMQLTENAGDN